jgi:hypothetical protein
VSEERAHRVVLEVELPDVWVEHLTPRALADLIAGKDESYDDAVLSQMMIDSVALLVVEVEGDKDSSVTPTTALVRSARLIPAAESAERHYQCDYIKDARWNLARNAWRDLKYEASRDEPVMNYD